jgi:hypothetical protein
MYAKGMAHRGLIFERRDGMVRMTRNWPEPLDAFREYEALTATIGT